MKGIVFNLLERAVSDRYGEDVWDSILDAAAVDGAYTAVGTYPHEQLGAIVAAASKALDVPPDDLIRWFGRAAMPMLAEQYPAFFEGHSDTRSFLLTLNDVIHPEVRKLFPGAYAPSFEFDTSVEDELGLSYISHRNLCAFAEGLIEGAADRYGEDVFIEQTSCTQRGDPSCVIHIRFKKS
jgi:Haem-NO-binding